MKIDEILLFTMPSEGMVNKRISCIFMLSETKMLYLGAQEELEAHLGHASMYFEPYKSFGVEIKSIANS